VVRAPYSYEIGELGSGDLITVEQGFQTDFASVPRLLSPIVARWGQHGKAAVVHDYLYLDQGRYKKQSDEIFREAMGVLGVARWKKFLIYRAVKWFGGGSWSSNLKRRERGVDRVQPLPVRLVEGRTW
jgi:hypothetical protein|tara:strand:- start:411 stop:794 length:384 start_codon:yes stop_codon:yes gene_type:complete